MLQRFGIMRLKYGKDYMVKHIKARKTGGSIGVTIPREFTEKLHIEEGDELAIVETEEGLLLAPYNPEFEEAMKAYKKGAKKYQNALRELAK